MNRNSGVLPNPRIDRLLSWSGPAGKKAAAGILDVPLLSNTSRSQYFEGPCGPNRWLHSLNMLWAPFPDTASVDVILSAGGLHYELWASEKSGLSSATTIRENGRQLLAFCAAQEGLWIPLLSTDYLYVIDHSDDWAVANGSSEYYGVLAVQVALAVHD